MFWKKKKQTGPSSGLKEKTVGDGEESQLERSEKHGDVLREVGTAETAQLAWSCEKWEVGTSC